MEFKDKTTGGILRSLVADEFLAWTSYYFYEIVAQGKALNFVNKIFNKNGKDELEDHYKKLVTWMQSNDIPVPTGLSEMQDICNTPYHAYQDSTKSEFLVQQMIDAEKDAIESYDKAMREPAITAYPDLVVMLGEICTDEREHLKDLRDVKSNIVEHKSFSKRLANIIK